MYIVHTPRFSAICSELLSMIHSMLEISAVDLRAQGYTTHQMVHHTDAHAQVDAYNFCDYGY